MEECLATKNDDLELKVKKKKPELRLFHMVTKYTLSSYPDEELTTEVQFPHYMNKLKIQKKNKQI